MKLSTVLAAVVALTASVSLAHATVYTVYQDDFNGNGGTAPTAATPLNGGSLVATGLAGGTANATWTSAAAVTGGNPDAAWVYTGSGSASITSAASTSARDSSLISNAYLPFTPQAGFVYDFHLNMQVPAAGTDNHWAGLAFVNGNMGAHDLAGGGSSGLSNDIPYGLVIVRDGVVSATNSNWLDIFQGATGGTSGDTQFAPGTVGSTVAVDVILDTTGTGTQISWKLNGTLVGAPVTLDSGTLSGNPIKYVTFGTNTAPSAIVSNFSLTANGTIAVPEPASLGLLGLGAVALLARRRK